MSKTAGLIKEQDFNYYGLIQLPELWNGSGFGFTYPIIGTQGSKPFPDYEYCYYYANGQKATLTWLDLYDHMNDLTSASIYYDDSNWNRIRDLLFNEQYIEVVESAEYKQAREDFENNTSFLYGSFEDGYGLYMVKSSNNTFRLRLLHGFYDHITDIEQDIHKYYYHDNMPSVHDFTIEELSSVFFFWYNSIYDVDRSEISMIAVPNSELNTSVRYTIGYNTPEVAGGFRYVGWKEGYNLGTLEDSAFCKWDSSLEFITYPIYPFQILYGNKDVGHYSWYSYETPTNTFRLKGQDLQDFYEEDVDNAGPSTAAGGGGGYPTNSDECKDPDAEDLNSVNVVNSGLVTLYNPSMGGLQSFANFLFTGITDNIATQLKKLVSNPIDYVLFCSLCKFTPPISDAEEITFCGIGTGVTSNVIPNQFYTLDCGTLEIPEDSETFMDFSPHSKVQLYVPYCGIHELNPDDIKGSKVHIKYNIDMLSGSCVASVEVQRRSRDFTDASINTSLYKFNGNCYLTMPLSATDWRGAYNSMIQFAGGIVATAAGKPMEGIGAIASAVTQQKVSVGRSGPGGSNYGHMSDGKPYFILSRPTPSIPYNFKGFEGYKSNIRYNLRQLKGYTEIDENTLWTDGFEKATEKECQMIKEIMSKGVYL